MKLRLVLLLVLVAVPVWALPPDVISGTRRRSYGQGRHRGSRS
jgi:hypothetical protein